ncbi:orotate phosphoribosyltransferase [Methanoplanus sp. FWC-SCC4]|uniref:Orotate phosphoribosyltransferase n=1 Tax=Methanochimaera problematica TaxID=2609417 RepID=A0AA97FBR8_9EURY|nr:orotate phosphoribosyltransferase [Methanoplanus sp. FWC-SCC4]WOF16162.1 orotate phosphoribosyltransferase [Methanoplanus sp. FWC-SCC4]
MVNEIAEVLIKYGAIEFGDFTLASGAKSSYYIDIKTASTNPELLSPIGKAIAEKFDFDVVAGVAVGAVPIAVSVSIFSGKPYSIIRKEKKEHGKSGAIIGDVKGKNVLLVEDVTTSGGSVIYGIDALRDAGAIVKTVVTVVDREQGASEKLSNSDVKLVPLVRVSEILKKDNE